MSDSDVIVLNERSVVQVLGESITRVYPSALVTLQGGEGGSLLPLDPDPSGTYPFANITVNDKGQVTAASAGEDVASESTQQSILANVASLSASFAGFTTNGINGTAVSVLA